jgi:hypothetical protein
MIFCADELCVIMYAARSERGGAEARSSSSRWRSNATAAYERLWAHSQHRLWSCWQQHSAAVQCSSQQHAVQIGEQ